MLFFVVHVKESSAFLYHLLSAVYANHKNSNFRAHAAPNKLFMQICFQYLIPNRWEDAKLQSKNLKNAFDQSRPQHQQKASNKLQFVFDGDVVKNSHHFSFIRIFGKK